MENNNICFKAYSGEMLTFLGENGAGKSTLLKVLNGDYQPASRFGMINTAKANEMAQAIIDYCS